MGIDIYARWKNQTPKQKKKQITGFSVEHGNVGYLREAYRGEHFATRYLCREAALLQTFPREYKFPENASKTSIALQIGNALPPKFSYIQSSNIMNHLVAAGK